MYLFCISLSAPNIVISDLTLKSHLSGSQFGLHKSHTKTYEIRLLLSAKIFTRIMWYFLLDLLLTYTNYIHADGSVLIYNSSI